MSDLDSAVWHDMHNRLQSHDRECWRSREAGIYPPKPEISVLAFKVAIEVSHKNTFGKILHALVQHREEIRPDVRHYLIEALRKQAVTAQRRPAWGKLEPGFRNARERNATFERCAQLWKSVADQLGQAPVPLQLLQSRQEAGAEEQAS